MNVESQTHGLPDWHFPSPSSTPKSADFHQHPFQTPKSEASSHFLDAYYTPQLTGHQTPAATPTVDSFTVVRRSAGVRHSPLTPDDPTFHVNHYKERNLPLPPVDSFRRLSSSPDSLSSSSAALKALSTPQFRQEDMDSFQMRTPPPTRDSSTRRNFNNPQQNVSYTLGNTFEQHAVTPGRPPVPTLQTPQFQASYQNQQLQYSPEMFQFPGGVPQSAPAAGHARYPWDDSPPMGACGHTAMMDLDPTPFPNNVVNPGVTEWAHHTSAMQQQNNFQQPIPAPMIQSNQASDFWTSNGVDTQATTVFSQDRPFILAASGVNPNELFSFSSLPKTINPASVRHSTVQLPSESEGRRPYEHQAKESHREKGFAKKGRQLQSRAGNLTFEASGLGSVKLGLQRSKTDSGTRRAQRRPIDPQRNTQLREPISRGTSPLKRNSQALLSAIPETVRPRPRTRLVVDANGSARTESVPAGESIVVDRRKSFGLWNEDDDTDDEDLLLISQRNSFVLTADSLQRRPSKHAREDSDSDHFDVSKRPVSSASVNSLASRLETTPIGKNLTTDASYRRLSFGSTSRPSGGDNISPSKGVHTSDEGPTDAQGALKRVMEDRARRQELNDPQALLDAHNQRWSQVSFDVAKLSAINEQHVPYEPFIGNLNTSLSPALATNPIVLTPPPIRSAHSDESTHCVCNGFSNAGIMVQCESCSKWSHMRCVGLNELYIPPVYVCIYCTATPAGVAVRAPVQQRPVSFASPLGYKSETQFR